MSDIKSLRITSGKGFSLKDWDPDDASLAPAGKSKTSEEVEELALRIGELQELLYAEHKQKVLIVLQGMDTSGKDGAVKDVMSGVNPQNVRGVSFKKPTEAELAHDYLWRVHANVPGAGEITIFNRSHYEDVLVVRVHSLVPEAVWRKRYDQINDFERMLTETGTVVLKFFLHISKDEQRERLQARIDDKTKRWKFQHGDIEERKLWDDYQRAYDEAIEKTATKYAPWVIVPANRKWYRNWVVATAIVEALEKLKMKYPEPDLSGVKIV